MSGKSDIDILTDMLQIFSRWVHKELSEVSADALYWHLDEDANNIAVTVWHFSRGFDILKIHILENRPSEEELWFTSSWARLTGYDPRGLGWGGFGFLAGYTREEVEGVPKLSADELVKYFDQTVEALCDYIQKLPSEDLYRPAAGWPDTSDTAYEWIRHFLMDSLGHLGEIRAIHAMWERRIRVV
ncbi:MAG: DinB family protein [Anaerolineales bacterium]|nr:DinB family protein [Anaerolineales bacterium]